MSHGAPRHIRFPINEKSMTAIAPRRSVNQLAGVYVPATRFACLPLPNPPLGILSVSAAAEDHIAVRQSLCGIPCGVQTAESCHSAFQILRYGRISIVV